MNGTLKRGKGFASSRSLYHLVSAGCLVSFATVALGQNNSVVAWGDATAARLSHFLPQAEPGLIERMPWDDPRYHEPGRWAGVSGGTPLYVPFGVTQRWVFDEPALVRQVEETQKQVDAERKLLLQQMQSQARARASFIQAHMREYQACNQGRHSKIQELIREGKYAEASKVPECPRPAEDTALEKYDAKKRELDERMPDLEARTRFLVVAINANEGPLVFMAGPTQPVGTLKGRPLYRTAETSVAGNRVVLSVYVGPTGFRNPDSKTSAERAELKCLVVEARVNSRPDTVKEDEALAMQMLKKVDYAGLAKLVQP